MDDDRMDEPGGQGVVTKRILVLGAGFSGLGMAIRLRQAGMEDFLVLDAGETVGGTWRENRYPGCACDVQSHLYSFSFAPNPDWSHMFAPQAEILAYLARCAERYGIGAQLRLGRQVERARYDEDSGTWELACANGERYRAPVFICAMGPLSRPAMPQIPGLERFGGPVIHSARWPQHLDLAGKRVAVIGTGASAIQFVPQVAPQAAQLILFQRTPPWILPRPDRRVSGPERWLFRRLPASQRLARGALYLRLEGRALGLLAWPGALRGLEYLARRHLRRSVPDPALRARLTPDYRIGCKRVLLSDDYYPALCRDNVELVTAAIERVEPGALVTGDGGVHPAEVILLGTGFQATSPVPEGMILGRGGRDLAAQWRAGPEAYLGTTVHGFPNLFFLVGPNTGLGHNSMIYMIESQVAYVLDCLRQMQEAGLAAVEVRQSVQAAYNRALQGQLSRAVWSSGCHSWYLHPSGKNTTLWPGYTFQFRRRTRRFDPRDYLCDHRRHGAGRG